MKSDELMRDQFLKSKKLFCEAEICYNRSILIRLNPEDIHGSIEALQHCYELCLKSLYMSLGLEYPKCHDAALNIHKIRNKLFELFPSEIDKEGWMKVENWIRRNSEYMKKLHETTIYGDENKNIAASELFDEKELSDLTRNVAAFYTFIYEQLILMGDKLGLLTEIEKEIHKQHSLQMKKLYDDPKKWEKFKKQVIALLETDKFPS